MGPSYEVSKCGISYNTPALSTVYPTHQWSLYSFHRPHQISLMHSKKQVSKGQGMNFLVALQGVLRELFPNVPMEINFRHPDINKLEYDVSVLSHILVTQPDIYTTVQYSL